jgi:hypothetical protein
MLGVTTKEPNNLMLQHLSGSTICEKSGKILTPWDKKSAPKRKFLVRSHEACHDLMIQSEPSILQPGKDFLQMSKIFSKGTGIYD